MANVTAADFGKKPIHMAEFGNCVSEDFAALALTGVNQNEKAYIGVIPAGTRVQDVRVVTSGTLGAATTLSLGYEPVDGSNPAADATYWMNATTSTSALDVRPTAAAKTFDYAVKIVATVGGGNVASSPTIAVWYQGKAVGAK